jgi:CBS domain-containing protein
MKNKLSSHQSLHALFENDINVNHISEEIETCHLNDSVEKAIEIMDRNEYDCLGIEDNGKVIGYVVKSDLKDGICKSYVNYFKTTELVSETTSLIQTLYLLKETNRIFVLEGNKVTRLVTYSDLQKAPVQLLLFGLVSLVEMNLLKIIKITLQNNSWKPFLKESRIEKAEEIFSKRRELKAEIELSDCLQLCDKRDILLANEKLLNILGFESKNKTDKYLKKLEKLRNDLAHAQEFMNNFSYEEIISLVEQTERILEKIERNLYQIS